MRPQILILAMLAMSLAVGASAYPTANGLVDVTIVDKHGQPFRDFPARESRHANESRAYLMAEPGARYGVRVTNRSNERIGLVIAVDGRNIVSGKKSKLRSKERMYVLGPYQTATYRGWRTGHDRVNEFFFTSDLDSYAGAFGDYSAMGVVAVAAFRDRHVPVPYYRRDQHADAQGHGSPSRRGKAQLESEAPGTGFGDERYAPSYRVEFDPQRRAAGTTLIKYEWRETLCEMGVARCYSRPNRLWSDRSIKRRHRDRGYAAYPPGYRYRQSWQQRG